MFPADAETAQRLPANAVLATIRQRSLAAILDELIVLVPAFVIALIWALSSHTKQVKIGSGELLVITFVSAVVAVTYHTVSIAVWGRTVGKLVTHVRVVRADTAGPPGWWYAGIRALVPAVAGAIPQVGTFLVLPIYLLALFDPRRQGVHDKAAGTIVISSKDSSG
jgi:uncharacterized RDD family membrane protein YckC